MNPDASARRAVDAERRRLAVKMFNKGSRTIDIARILGVVPSTISRWVRRERESGPETLKSGVPGRTIGQGRMLSPDGEARVKKTISENPVPSRIGISHALWTRAAVVALIEKLCGVTLDVRTAGAYLKRWGMTSKRPARLARQRNPQEVENFEKKRFA